MMKEKLCVSIALATEKSNFERLSVSVTSLSCPAAVLERRHSVICGVSPGNSNLVDRAKRGVTERIALISRKDDLPV